MSNKICSVENCESQIKAKGYCGKHYTRFRNHGDPLFSKLDRNHSETCKIDGCNKKYISKGFCSIHYRRFNEYGNPLYVEKEIVLHGMTNTPEYTAWINMKQRCFNPNNKSYPDYGGRGITVCDRWKNSFNNFYEDMGLKPFMNAEIDRENNNLGYTKENCRWVTKTVNIQNRSNVRLTTENAREIRALYLSGSKKVKDIALCYGVSPCTVADIGKGRTWKDA